MVVGEAGVRRRYLLHLGLHLCLLLGDGGGVPVGVERLGLGERGGREERGEERGATLAL